MRLVEPFGRGKASRVLGDLILGTGGKKAAMILRLKYSSSR